METMDPLDLVSTAGDPAFATDQDGRIVIWNRAAESLLRRSAAEVLGKPCHEVLCGVDLFGNRYCDEACPLTFMVRRDEPVRHFELDLRGASGGQLRVSISVVVIKGKKPRRFTMVHLLHPVGGSSDHSLVRRLTRTADFLHGGHGEIDPEEMITTLTAREVEVLRLIADGSTNQQVADSLYISVATVRNHVQNILHKLDLHSKLEAVSFALRKRLI